MENIPNKFESASENIKPDVKFFEDKKTLLLNIPPQAVNLDTLQEKAKQNGMEPKEEFHVTAIGFKTGNKIKEIIGTMPSAQQQVLVENIQSIINETDWSCSLLPDVFHISKEYTSKDQNTGKKITALRESYIQKVSLPGLTEFYNKLNNLLGTSFEIPPIHITLFTGGNDKDAKMGIGITSESELEKMNPETVYI